MRTAIESTARSATVIRLGHAFLETAMIRHRDWRTRSKPLHGLAMMLAVAVLGTGCGGGGPSHPVNPTKARDALVQTLDHWKSGGTPGSMATASPPVTVQDFDWTQGTKLTGYEIVGDGTSIDANLSIKVKLDLVDANGKPVEKTVSYLVGTSPSITVFRDMFKR